MPPRLNKRQQRELEELNALHALSPAEEPGSSTLPQDVAEEPEAAPLQTTTLGFSALRGEDKPSEEDEEEDESKTTQARAKSRKSKKKKKPASTPATGGSAPPTPRREGDPPSTGQKSKGKGKAPKKDAFDAALDEMAAKYPEIRQAVAQAGKAQANSQSAARDRLWQLLSVDPKHLDGDAELRRFFGAKVVNSTKPPARRNQAVLRSQLTRPAATWSHLRGNQGITMRPLEPAEVVRKEYAVESERWWTIEHTMSYKKVVLQFLNSVALGDPNEFAVILQRNPWHIDTLLQMGEVFRQQEDWSHANDLVERAIYAYERSFTSSFNVTTGVHRLDFDRIENRPFFLAVHRQIIQMMRRGCTRTAFEFSRLMLSLDPSGDPHGALLYLDFLGPRAGMNQWVLDMWETWDTFCKEEALGPDDDAQRVDLRCLPGWSYAKALALWNMEVDRGDKEHKDSTAALKEAILAFPSVLPLVADKAGITLSAEARGHPALRIETGWNSNPAESAIHLLSHLYAQRSSTVWKQPTHVSWVQSTVPSLLSELPRSTSKGTKRHSLYARALIHFSSGPTLAICRHAIVAEVRSVLAFFPPHTLSAEMLAYDPLPPLTSVSKYDEQYFGALSELYTQEAGARARRQRPLVGAGLQEADDDMAERIRQLMLAQGIDGVVPGGFDLEQEPEEETDEDEDQPHDQAPAAEGDGLLRTFYNMLWGRPAMPESDGED